MGQWFKVFLSNFLSSIFISVVMFVIMFSVITQQFPPDFSKIGQAFKAMKEMSGLHTAFNNELSKQGTSADEDVDILTKLQQGRTILGEKIFNNIRDDIRTEVVQSVDVRIVESERRISALQSRVEALTAEVEALKAQRQ